MGAALLLARAEMRRRWRSLVVLALFVGFAGTVVLTAAAGARRSASSFDRFLESSRVPDATIFMSVLDARMMADIRRVPGTEAIGFARQLAVVIDDDVFLPAGGALDDVVLRDVFRQRIVEGRAPARGAAEEVAVGEPLAREYGLEVGETFVLNGYAPDQVAALLGEAGTELPSPAGPSVRMRVVGIARIPSDLSIQGASGGLLMLPLPFVEKYGDGIGSYSPGVIIARLTDGAAGVARFVDRVEAAVGNDVTFDVEPSTVTTGGVQESIDVLTIGVVLFAAIAGIAALVAIGLSLTRQVSAAGPDQDTLRALGMSRALRACSITGPASVAVLVGAALAVVGAWIASTTMPTGLARRAEPDPGMQFDALVLVGGSLVMAVALAAIVAITAWRVAGRRVVERGTAADRPSVVARSLEGSGLAPAAVIGVRLALEPGRGRTAVPVRSSLVGAALAVVGVVAVALIAASLEHLVESPRAYGVTWDVRVLDTRAELQHAERPCRIAESRLTDDRAVAAVASACLLNIQLGGDAVAAFGFTNLRGSIEPTVLEGRAARRRDEVALGTTTQERLGLAIGDGVSARGPSGDIEYRIVGRVAVPSFEDAQAVSDGAIFTGAGLDRLDDVDDDDGIYQMLVRFAPDVDHAAAARRLDRLPGTGELGFPGVTGPEVPLDVERLRQVDQLPLALGVFLAALGAVAVAHLLVTSVRRRRRDFAILKSVGFRRRQVIGAIGWQATTVALIGIAFGVLIGLSIGSVTWRALAENAGVLPEVKIPVVALLLTALGAVLVANLVALLPALAAARTQPAVTLRTE